MWGNGVKAGQIAGYVTVYDPTDSTTEETPFNNFFSFKNYNSVYAPFADFAYNTINPIGGGNSEFGDNNYIYWDFYESGIFYSKAPWNESYLYNARDLKVDIAYKMTLFVAETADNFC